MKIKKCVMAIAGKGTRMLPITKTITKEMLPIIDTPILFKQVKEAYLSGIEEIIFVVTEKNIEIVKDYFRKDKELDDFIQNDPEKQAMLQELYEIIDHMTFHYVIEEERGSYGAVYAAKPFLHDESFAVMFADDLVDDEIPLLKQLISEYERTNDMIMAAKETPLEELPNYGMVRYKKENIIDELVYKKENPLPSRDVIHGRFIVHTKIFDIKEKLPYHKNKELHLPEAILMFDNVRALTFKGKYLDVGNKLGYLKANIYYALKDEKIRYELESFIREIL